MAIFFGGFQAVMPLVGWLAGLGLKDTIAAYDHWVAFGLLAAVGIIGLITFALSYAGYQIGRTMGHFFEKKIEIFGGLILIAIGLKILISHLYAP